MKRRSFLKSVGAIAPGAIAVATPGSTAATTTPRKQDGNDEPRVFFYDDGRHGSGFYQFEPPLIPDDLNVAVDQLVDSGVDTLFYSAGLEGGAVQYDSRVAAKWGDNVDQWNHAIFYRASRNLHQLIADGHDPMNFLAERCHQKGIFFLPTCPVGIVGGTRETDLGFGRKSDFVLDNPQFYTGKDNDPRAENLGRFLGPNRLSFIHTEVRKERFLIFEELLSRYETDGIELDLSIDNEFGPLCRFQDLDQFTSLLTQFIRDLHTVARRAEKEQARRKRIYVRIPAASTTHWKALGYDVPTWVAESIVDGLVAITPHKKETRDGSILFLDQNLNLAPAVELTRKTGCRVLAGLASSTGRQLAKVATPEMTWAAAALAYDSNADGFGFCSGMWTPDGWPWESEQYTTLRLLGHPDLLATADKTYLAPSQAMGSGKGGTLSDGRVLLPRTLEVGETLKIPLRITDDLARMSALDRVQSVHLWVRITNYEPSLNEVEICLNGQPLPDALRIGSDQHFRVLKNMVVGPYGFAFDYTLSPEYFPSQGDNEVSVRTVKIDPKLKAFRQLFDVALTITYLPHRNFQAAPIPF